MAFWSNQKLTQRIPSEGIIAPYDADSVKYCAYELKLGDAVFLTGATGKTVPIKAGEQIIIPPGQFALLITKEVVKLPANALALISIKASIKFLGLVNVSGFHVDPGFNGRLKFSVYNAGTREINLTSDRACFLIFFADLEPPAAPLYSGGHQGQREITSADAMGLQGQPASVAVLDERLKKIELQIEIWTRVVQAFVVAITLLLLGLWVKSCGSRESDSSKTGVTTNILRGSVIITQQIGRDLPLQSTPLGQTNSQRTPTLTPQQNPPTQTAPTAVPRK
jgi:dCTP deaminase